LSEVHCSPFQVLNDSLLNDTKSGKVFDVLTPPCYDIDTDIADFDEFIHVGRRRWDALSYDLDPIYDTEDHLQLLPLQLPRQITYDQWQQGDEVFTCSFQNTKDDLEPYLSDDFQSYLEMFDEYLTEHLDPICEDDCQPPLCSFFDTSKDIVCLKKFSHDFSPQPPVITVPGFSIKGVVGKYLFYVEFPSGQTLDSKGWLDNVISNQFFNLLLIVCQSSTKPLSFPSLTLEREDVLGNQSTGEMIQEYFSRIFEIKEQLKAIGDTIDEDEFVITALNGLARPWDAFIQSVCGRKEKLQFESLWEECTQEETRVANREALLARDDDQALATHTKGGRKKPYFKRESHREPQPSNKFNNQESHSRNFQKKGQRKG
jgi:hypothetical protein